MATDVRGLVDANVGLVDKRIFVEKEIYQEEMEKIFAKCWLFLGHESQIPNRAISSPPIWVRTRWW